MSSPTERVADAFPHRAPDRTPLFEIFSPFHPIYWDICGRTVATDAAVAWDAMAEGISWEELLEANIEAQYAVNRFFQVDMVRFNGAPGRHVPRPVKTGKTTWTLNGVRYHLDAKTDLVVLQNPANDLSYSHRYSEEEVRRQLEEWDGSCPDLGDDGNRDDPERPTACRLSRSPLFHKHEDRVDRILAKYRDRSGAPGPGYGREDR